MSFIVVSGVLSTVGFKSSCGLVFSNEKFTIVSSKYKEKVLLARVNTLASSTTTVSQALKIALIIQIPIVIPIACKPCVSSHI